VITARPADAGSRVNRIDGAAVGGKQLVQPVAGGRRVIPLSRGHDHFVGLIWTPAGSQPGHNFPSNFAVVAARQLRVVMQFELA